MAVSSVSSSSTRRLPSTLSDRLEPKYSYGSWSDHLTAKTEHAARPSTSRTACSASTAMSRWNNEVVVALINNRAAEIGLAACSMRTMEITLMQYSDLTTFPLTVMQIHHMGVAEVVVPATTVNGVLVTTLQENFAGQLGFASIPRRHFNEVAGLTMLRHIAADNQATLDLQAKDRYLCIAAASALVKYVEHVQKTTLASSSVRVKYRCMSDRVAIDKQSVKLLELLQSTKRRGKKGEQEAHSLGSFVDHTLTTGGSRLLRANLLMPLSNKATLDERFTAVEYLRVNEAVRQRVRTALKDIQGDVDQLLAHFSHNPRMVAERKAESNIQHVLALQNFIHLLHEVAASLEGADGGMLLDLIRKRLTAKGYESIQDEINSYLADTVVKKRAKCNTAMSRTILVFAVSKGIDGMLDVVRCQYSQTLEQIYRHGQQLATEYGITSLRVHHTSRRGFHLVCDAAEASKGDAVFILPARTGKQVACTTRALCSLNSRLVDAYTEVICRTSTQIDKLVASIRSEMDLLYKVSDAISLLDLIQSMATHVSLHQGYVRPVLSSSGSLRISKGRHPVWEKGLAGGAVYCPNDTDMHPDRTFLLVTGPNTGGKSTYLSQVALIVVLAHVGCFVPAETAEIALVDRICTRLGVDDSIEANTSTFTAEMRDVSYILQNATPRSLVLVDELGRGTSNTEGASISWAVAEHLIHVRCFTLFTTHFTQLHLLDDLYGNAHNQHFSVVAKGKHLQYQYRLVGGSCSTDGYGIALGRQVGLPSTVVDEAERMSAALQDASTVHRDVEWLLHRYASRLVVFCEAAMSSPDLLSCIRRLQSEMEHDVLQVGLTMSEIEKRIMDIEADSRGDGPDDGASGEDTPRLGGSQHSSSDQLELNSDARSRVPSLATIPHRPPSTTSGGSHPPALKRSFLRSVLEDGLSQSSSSGNTDYAPPLKRGPAGHQPHR